MSFTFSHIAMIIPLYNKYISLEGLIIGSIILDIYSFLNQQTIIFLNRYFYLNNYFSFKTILLFYIPLSIIVYIIYEYIIKIPFIIYSPNVIKYRFMYAIFRGNQLKDMKKFFVFIYSLLVGITLHIFIDEFTHPGTSTSEKFTLLSKKIYMFDLSTYLFIITSIIGIAIILLAIYKIKPYNNFKILNVKKSQKVLYWSLIYIITISSYMFLNKDVENTVIKAFIRSKDFSILFGILKLVTVKILLGFFVGVVCTSIIFNVLFKSSQNVKLIYLNSTKM